MNVSESNPYLSLSRLMGVSHGDVLQYVDYVDGLRSRNPVHMDAALDRLTREQKNVIGVIHDREMDRRRHVLAALNDR